MLSALDGSLFVLGVGVLMVFAMNGRAAFNNATASGPTTRR